MTTVGEKLMKNSKSVMAQNTLAFHKDIVGFLQEAK